jgi:RHS repeat-associated protein
MNLPEILLMQPQNRRTSILPFQIINGERLNRSLVTSSRPRGRSQHHRRTLKMESINKTTNKTLNNRVRGGTRIRVAQPEALGFSSSQVLIVLVMLFLGGIFSASAQSSVEDSKNKPDQTLRSNARINPSTLAMELSIPIDGLPGRAGATMPLVFNYSSKVWRIRARGEFETISGRKTEAGPDYADKSIAGWTSTYGIPKLDTVVQRYDCQGNAMTPTSVLEDGCGSPQYIKQMSVTLPDGSTHQLRKDDDVHQTTNGVLDKTGTYLAVDGSKMRLDWGSGGTSILFLPDGGQYFFDASENCFKYLDRNGNRLDYNSTTGAWTDTMGRTLAAPIPFTYSAQQNQAEGTENFTVPGLGTATRQYQLVWKKLSSGALISGQTQAYDSTTCNGLGPVSRNPVLFVSTTQVRLCSVLQNYFDPVVLNEIILPNGQKYKFQYNTFGEIARIDYPTGAYEKFTYAAIPGLGWDYQQNYTVAYSYGQANRGVTERWVGFDGIAQEQHWQYAAGFVTTSYDADTYYVQTTAPNGTVSKRYLYRTERPDDDGYSNYGFDTILAGMERETLAYDTNSQLRARKLFEWETTDGSSANTYGGVPQRDARVKKEISITFEPGATSALATMTENTYDSNSDPQYFAQLNPKTVKTYHYIALSLSTAQTASIATISALFSSSNLAQTSETDYLYDSNYKARGLVTLPTETRLKDAAGNVKAKSQVAYDESAYGIISAGTDAQWTDPSTTYRGNPTTSRAWTDVANNQYIETHAQFDNFGNARKAWDAKGNLSEVEFSSTYKYAYPTKTISTVPDPTGVNGSSTAFETTSVYDLATGLVTSTTDANGQTSTMEYNDSLLRPTKVIPPTGGAQTVMEYTDTPGAMSVKTKTQIDATNWAESTVYADGLGRTIKSEKKDDAGNVFTETEYDQVGRVKRSTNPYRTGETKLWTENTYDDLSRVTKVKTPDNAEVTTAYDLSTSGTLGTIVTVTDQAGKQRRSLTNGLGQLVRVDEPNDAGSLGTVASPNQSTSYVYDTLNNLITVNQGVQTRTFQYDSLSRLKNAVNPESGAISYTYDANGNLTGKTDARSITTTYAYDNLNRVKTRSYSDSTPAVAYSYDGTGLGSVPSYSKGKLTKVSSSVSETKYDSFDNLGRILTSQQITDGQTYTFGYAYNLGGMLTEETYPSGRKVKNSFATDGDLSKVETQPSGGAYATRADNFSYTAAGAVSAMQLGNAKWENAQFNSRLQPTQLGLGTSATDQSLWKVAYDYGTTDNNGNVKKQTITVPSITPLEQTYTYDSLNRIKSATENIQNSSETWKQTFQYDRYGNRNFDAANTTTLGSCSTAQCNPQVDAANNRFTTNQGYTYDLSGNLLTDAQNRSFFYDAENKQKEVKDASNNSIGTYFYDGDGKRVKKVSAMENTLFVYDASGKMVAEYPLTSATPQTATTSYLTSDTLGSPRVITDTAGNVTSRRDFMPFGEEIPRPSQGADSIRYKFTSYERDNETNLDYAQARFYGGSLGRFTSPDPLLSSAYLINPQTLNRYVYVLNNPLNIIDPLGLDGWYVNRNDLDENGRWKPKFYKEGEDIPHGYELITEDFNSQTNVSFIGWNSDTKSYSVLHPTQQIEMQFSSIEKAMNQLDAWKAGGGVIVTGDSPNTEESNAGVLTALGTIAITDDEPIPIARVAAIAIGTVIVAKPLIDAGRQTTLTLPSEVKPRSAPINASPIIEPYIPTLPPRSGEGCKFQGAIHNGGDVKMCVYLCRGYGAAVTYPQNATLPCPGIRGDGLVDVGTIKLP